MLIPQFELELLNTKYRRVVGIDEVGRGCLAGPVAVGHFVYELGHQSIAGVNDSKLVPAKQREQIFAQLIPGEFEVGYGTVTEIDTLGIAKVIAKLIQKVVDEYHDQTTCFLIDGYFPQFKHIQFINQIIKGDAQVYSIALAAIAAKVSRDRLMTEMSVEYPGYGFEKHKGYGTKTHRNALQSLGVSELHRKSYRPVNDLWLANTGMSLAV